MAAVSYFIVSPNLVLSVLGLLHGPDETVPTPAENWEDATVNVVIPALNEEKNIVLCLNSLSQQTIKPKNIILVDDGSKDNTVAYAKAFCEENGMQITVIQRDHPIGKTPTIKRQAREFISDVEFVLDADTILESKNYIQRTVQELYQGAGIASACGTILPIRDKDRKEMTETPKIKAFHQKHPESDFLLKQDILHVLARKMTNVYREILYMFLQQFIYHGQMVFFGSITNPVGCAVAYRRKYIEELFDQYEPIFGDDLTNSEDIFIGFALLKHGYRNVQLMDVYSRSQEPEIERIPHEIYMWSSSFFQSCYYFDDLVKSPFKSFKSYLYHRKMEKLHGEEIKKKRKVQEPYRQQFGDGVTTQYGRPMGWVIFISLIEKTLFPATLFVLIALGIWEVLGLTLLFESIISLSILAYMNIGKRWEYFFKGLLITPIRYATILFDFLTMIIFAKDIWFTKNKGWRK
jgi:glycosyltransferase involved in cell wall biosynthesis